MSRDEKFKVKSITKIEDIISGECKELPVSDLSIERDGHVIQFELESEQVFKKLEIVPGIFNLTKTMAGIIPTPMEVKNERLLPDFSNTKKILNEFNSFFNRLEIYEELGLDKKRGLLMYGPPGTGKTRSINNGIAEICKDDPNTVVFNWNTNDLDSSSVFSFFANSTDYKDVSRQLIIIEDIGMSVEGYGGPKSVDSSLLNFLDGIGLAFQVPTYIVATTNYAHNLPENLVNRPGRFDEWIEVGYPSAEERVVLAEFIGDNEISENEKEELKSSKCDEFSIAHIREVVIRAKRDGVGIDGAIQKLEDHKKRFNKGFETKKSGGGFGL